jgi:predicted neutral ceramidase superfamily lipid hydrolase
MNTVTEKNHLTFSFCLHIFIILISLHIFRSKTHKYSSESVFILNTTIIILSEHLVLSAYLVTAATVSDFSSYSICFIYTAKFWHQQDVYLTKNSFTKTFSISFISTSLTVVQQSILYMSVSVSSLLKLFISMRWNYWLSWDIKNHHSES